MPAMNCVRYLLKRPCPSFQPLSCFTTSALGCVLQATVYLLEKLDVLMSKASEEDIKSDLLPMIFATLESNSIQGQVMLATTTSRRRSSLQETH